MRMFACLWWVAAMTMGIAACMHMTPASLPEGFAAYPPVEAFKAVSPDGVVYRVRSVPNKPYAEIDFWKEAMKRRMLEAGYRMTAEAPIQAGTQKGYLLELAAPLGPQDFSYMIAIFVKKESIRIAEAAGEVMTLAKHRPALIKAMSQLTE